MKSFRETKIIGIDHGYGNMKTANHCFKTGISAYDSEPLFTADMLTYNGRYYLIGEGHKEFAPDKIKDEDYYVLTLAAIAKELKAENLTEAHVVLAAGLPLTWTSGQKTDFKAYLSKNAEVEFVYKKTAYHIYIDDVRIYPQGYAAIASFATTLKGVNLIADIGNGTMNVLYMINGKPQQGKMFTEKFGTYQCTLSIREAFMQKTQREINDAIVDNIDETETFPSHAQARRMRKAFEEGKLDYDTVTEIMNELKPNQVEKLKIPMDDIRKYVPKSMTPSEMQAYLLKLVKQDYERQHTRDAR